MRLPLFQTAQSYCLCMCQSTSTYDRVYVYNGFASSIASVTSICVYFPLNTIVLFLCFPFNTTVESVQPFVILLSFSALKCASQSKFNNERNHNNEKKSIRIRTAIKTLYSGRFSVRHCYYCVHMYSTCARIKFMSM